MTSYIRRAGANVLRTIARSLDPAAEADRVQLYAKAVGGVPQMFVRSPDFARQISGIECSIWDRPLQPHALDDEFESTVIDPAWNITTGSGVPPTVNGIDPFSGVAQAYSLHTNYRPSWMMIQPDTGSGTRVTKDITAITAGGDFFVWMRGSMSSRNAAITNNDATVALELCAAAGFDLNNRVSVNLNEPDASVLQAEFLTVVGGVTTSVSVTRDLFVGNTGLQAIEAVGLQRIAATNTYHGWAFGSSGHALYLGSVVYAPAVGTVTLRTVQASVAAPGVTICGHDFVRFQTGALFLP